MPEKILTCLTWPAITACGDAGRLQDLDALAQLAERDPVQVGAGLARRLLEIGERLLLDRDDGDVVAEAAGALQHEEGKPAVAGDEADACHCEARSLSTALTDVFGRVARSRRARPSTVAWRSVPTQSADGVTDIADARAQRCREQVMRCSVQDRAPPVARVVAPAR